MNNTECCPQFSPEKWDGIILNWENKNFIRGHVRTFWFMPLNFGKVMTKLMKKIEQAGARCIDGLGLSDHTSKWNMDILIAVDKPVPNADNCTLHGRFICKVYEGPFKDTGKWGIDFREFLSKQNLQMKKCYMWYTTCPKCAKKYGKNYVVFIAEI